MKLGFTFDEKILSKISYEALIEKSKEYDTLSLEVSPDTAILPSNIYKGIISTSSNFNMDINYHIPYFASEEYELENFSTYEREAKKKYNSFLNLLEDLQSDIKNNPIIVVHGSNYNENEKSVGMDNTLKFLDWMLNIISSKNLNFTLALETLRKKDVRNVCDNRDDVFYILNRFNSDKLKICWDICHDKLNFYPNETNFDDNFLKEVIYCHIHGHNLKSDTSHISLVKSDIDYSNEMKVLDKYNFKGSMNIEILSNFCEDTYLEDLFNDLNFMKKSV